MDSNHRLERCKLPALPLSYSGTQFGAPGEIRTRILPVRSRVLFQFSFRSVKLAPKAGLEPATIPLTAGRSTELSYLGMSWRKAEALIPTRDARHSFSKRG